MSGDTGALLDIQQQFIDSDLSGDCFFLDIILNILSHLSRLEKIFLPEQSAFDQLIVLIKSLQADLVEDHVGCMTINPEFMAECLDTKISKFDIDS